MMKMPLVRYVQNLFYETCRQRSRYGKLLRNLAAYGRAGQKHQTSNLLGNNESIDTIWDLTFVSAMLTQHQRSQDGAPLMGERK